MQRKGLFNRLLRRGSERSFRAISTHLKGERILDIGAAEGWVGEMIAHRLGLEVELVDVVDLNETKLPHCLYNGKELPFPDKSFDTVLVMLTLHHCEDPELVLREAIRVSRRRLIITESTYRYCTGRALLWAMDTVVNSWRSRNLMPEALHFKTVKEWRMIFKKYGLKLRLQRHLSKGLHRHVLFVLDHHV